MDSVGVFENARGTREIGKRRGGHVAFSTKLLVYKRDEYECFFCGKRVRPYERAFGSHPDAATVDHKNPQADGGSHSISNLITSCHSCNSEKGRKDVEQYRAYKRWKGYKAQAEGVELIKKAGERLGERFAADIAALVSAIDASVPAYVFNGEAK